MKNPTEIDVIKLYTVSYIINLILISFEGSPSSWFGSLLDFTATLYVLFKWENFFTLHRGFMVDL